MKSGKFATAYGMGKMIMRAGMKTRWRWLLCAVFFTLHSSLFTLNVVAQRITASAPSQVAVGEQFRLTYTVNTDDVEDL